MEDSRLKAVGETRVLVLAGGDSPEREVSLRSGAAVGQALGTAGYQTTALDPADRELTTLDWSEVDCCFFALHGGAGEDGQMQAQLEELGVPYTGSGPRACRMAMSKRASKEQFARRDVLTPACVEVAAGEKISDLASRVERLGYPLIVKPDGAGSSLGLSVVDAPEQLAQAVASALRYDDTAIIETLIRGREFTVALLDDRPLPIMEIVAAERVFSYDAKYESARTECLFDFKLATTRKNAVRRAAQTAAQALETIGLVRVDLILAADGKVFVLELNTTPGMTERSLAPLAARQSGIEMPQLCHLLVQQSLSSLGVR